MGTPMSDAQPSTASLGARHLYPNYGQPPLVIERGRGSELWDDRGRRYLDMYAGIAVTQIGHAHPRWVAAVAEQAAKLAHLSNYYYSAPNARLAAALAARTGFTRAFFCNSGAEAIEASLKLARRHYFSRGDTARDCVIAFENSFHGRTLGALAATGQAKYREGFGPLGGVRHVPFGDIAAVEKNLDPSVAAILVEPIQGEGGVIPAPPGFLKALRQLADEHGALLLFDEIQTGVGRTGTFLACEQSGVLPDVVALAKGLGGGIPIGAMLCGEDLAGALPPGSHGTTFGGNPIASAAALAVLETIDEEGLLAAAEQRGAQLRTGLDALLARYPETLDQVRGTGLMQALVFQRPDQATAALTAARESGVLLTLVGGLALRFTPALTITEQQLAEGLELVEQALKAIV